jgi:hypothetical protein
MYLIIILTIEINNNNNNNKNDIVWLILSLFFSQSQRCADRQIWIQSSFSLLYYNFFYLKRCILANIIIVLLLDFSDIFVFLVYK